MDNFLTSTISGIIGTLIGALLAYLFARRAYKATVSFDFHREFNTVEMCRHRDLADEIIQQFPDHDFNKLLTLKSPGVESLVLVMRFYERLWIAIKYRQVKNSVICEMFSENFFYWYYLSFEENFVGADWFASKSIEHLAGWFREAISDERCAKLRDRNRKTRLQWLADARRLEEE